MDVEKIKKDYRELEGKYGLPSWEELDKEFELLYFGETVEITYVLRFVKRRIDDLLRFYANILQGVLQPNPSSPISLQESKFFDQEEMKKIADLLKKIMILERQSLSIDIEKEEEKEAQYIKKSVGELIEIKKEMIEIASILREGWKKETKKEKTNYFG